MDNNNYLKLICRDICLDEELNYFFIKLTGYYDNIQSRIIKNNYESITKPTLDEVKIKLEELIKTGISVVRPEMLMEESSYSILLDGVTALSILNTGKFKTISNFSEDDIEIFKNRIKAIELGLESEFLSAYEKEYKKWQEENNFDDLNEKYHAIIKKRRREELWFGEHTGKYEAIYNDIKNKIEWAFLLKCRANFFENITYEQMKAIVELHDTIDKTMSEYRRYYYNKNAISRDIEVNSSNYYEKAYNEIINQSLNEVNTESILKKVFIIAFTRKIKKTVTIDENEIKTDFSIDSVDWFLKYKENELNQLFNLLINNLDTALDAVSDKVGEFYGRKYTYKTFI